MSIIQCIECGKSILSNSPECPYCRYPLPLFTDPGHPMPMEQMNPRDSHALKSITNRSSMQYPSNTSKSIFCNVCGYQISVDLENCPHCRFPLPKNENLKTSKSRPLIPSETDIRTNSGIGVLFFSFCWIFVGIAGLVLMRHGLNQKPSLPSDSIVDKEHPVKERITDRRKTIVQIHADALRDQEAQAAQIARQEAEAQAAEIARQEAETKAAEIARQEAEAQAADADAIQDELKRELAVLEAENRRFNGREVVIEFSDEIQFPLIKNFSVFMIIWDEDLIEKRKKLDKKSELEINLESQRHNIIKVPRGVHAVYVEVLDSAKIPYNPCRIRLLKGHGLDPKYVGTEWWIPRFLVHDVE